MKKHKKKETFFRFLAHEYPKKIAWAILLTFFTGAVFLGSFNTLKLKVSLLQEVKHAPFDGTGPPIMLVPNWSKLTATEYKLPYEQIPVEKLIALPKFDAEKLKTPFEELKWGNLEHEKIRNMKITYSVPYLGSYDLKGVEGAGSHPGVDIKIPDNTPIYAIANGAVTKISTASAGFGQHIIVTHRDVPTLTDQNSKTTLHSIYAHLGNIFVKEGEVVTKGQQIGISGHSGFATTPHIHFQLDNDSAPWHAYWPFTSQESKEKGLTFVESINAGLGKDKALLHTVNPVAYSEKYVIYSGAGLVAAATDVKPAAPQQPQPEPEKQPEPSLPANPEPQPEPIVQPPPEPLPTTEQKPAKIVIEHDGQFAVNEVKFIKIKLLDEKGELVTTPPQDLTISIMPKSGAIALSTLTLTAQSFENGVATLKLKPKTSDMVSLTFSSGTLTADAEPLKHVFFPDISIDHKSYEAVRYLRERGIIKGYSDGTFGPEKVVTRAEALKFIMSGLDIPANDTGWVSFTDVVRTDWFFSHLRTALNLKVIKGYADNTFKPNKTVSRAEFVKMLIATMNVPVTENPSAWYEPYVTVAAQKNILPFNAENFEPEKGMTRADVAQMLYRLIITKQKVAETYSEHLVAEADF